MKKLILLLLVIGCLNAQAAQVIQSASISDVTQHLEVQFTFNPNNDLLYAWERHLQPVWFGTWHYCFLYYITPNPMTQTSQFPVSNVYNSTGISSVMNPKNSSCWFVTNAVNLDQSGYD